MLLKLTFQSGRTLLHWAAISGNLKLVTYLVEQGCHVDATDDTDITPLILAASSGRPEVVAYLLKKGATVNQQTTQGHSALQYAASKGFLEVNTKKHRKPVYNSCNFRFALNFLRKVQT